MHRVANLGGSAPGPTGALTESRYAHPGYALEQKSSIIAIGLSVHHTPVDIREKLSIPQVGAIPVAQRRPTMS